MTNAYTAAWVHLAPQGRRTVEELIGLRQPAPSTPPYRDGRAMIAELMKLNALAPRSQPRTARHNG